MSPLAVVIPLVVATALALLLYVLKHADCTADPGDNWDDWDDWDNWEDEE